MSATTIYGYDSFGSAESLAAGDLLTLVGPSTADATLAAVRITLLAVR